MNDKAKVRRLGVEDAPDLHILRRTALESEPFAFGSSPEDDVARELTSVQRILGDTQEQAIFGLELDGRLIGMVGVRRESKLKVRHRAQIWGMFVAPEGRNQGGGRALMEAALEHARHWTGVDRVHLSVTATARTAARLYQSLGFRVWGTEPQAMEWNGNRVDEAHLILDLNTPQKRPEAPRALRVREL